MSEGPGEGAVGGVDGPASAATEPPDGEPGPPATGLAEVDRVLAREARVRELSIPQQAAAYEQLHDELAAVLDREPGVPPEDPEGP